MTKLPMIFDFGDINRRLNKLDKPFDEENVYAQIEENLKAKPLAKGTFVPTGKAVILSDHDGSPINKKAKIAKPKKLTPPLPRKSHNFNFSEKDMIKAIDIQIAMYGNMPTSLALWEELKRFVQDEYDWWYEITIKTHDDY
jgi:hypothetical protein